MIRNNRSNVINQYRDS